MMPRGAAVLPYDGKRGRVWRIKYVDAAGKQAMETIGAERDGVTRRQAEAELRDRLVKVEKRGWRKPAPLTFQAWSASWFADGQKRRGWKPRTVARYRRTLEVLDDYFGASRLASIRPRDVAAFTRDQLDAGYAPRTVNTMRAVLHDLFRVAVTEELLDSNPATNVEGAKAPRNKWRILQPAEVPALAKAFTDARARRVFLTLTLTGLRRSEVVGLRWRHLDMLAGTLRVEESKSEEGERLIALPHSLCRELADHYAESKHRGDDDYVFGHPERGSHLDDKWWKEQFDAARAAVGITDHVRSFHDLRHTALTNLAATGASPIAVMATAGHRSMATTRQYVHLAGVVFRDDADALERRLLGVESSTHLTAPEQISDDAAALETAVPASADQALEM